MNKTRNFLSKSTSSPVGKYKEFPGKLDHTTVACFRVGYTYDKSKITKKCTDNQEPHISLIKRKKRFSRLQRSLTVSSDNMVVNEVKAKFNVMKNTLKFTPLESDLPSISNNNKQNNVSSKRTLGKSLSPNSTRKKGGGIDNQPGAEKHSLRTRIHNVARTKSERAVNRLKRSKKNSDET